METMIGILPAAGVASRLQPLRYPKELLPIVFVADSPSGQIRPIVSAEYSLVAMHEAGIRQGVIIISESKTEILKYFGDGSELGLNLVYAVQVRPLGLPQAIAGASDWISGHSVCLTLPDTIFRPRNAVALLRNEFLRTSADLVLGVFPTQEPRQLGPVRVADDGRVLEVQDKPAATDLRHAWGMAVWSARFTSLLCDYVKRWLEGPTAAKECVLGDIFNLAVHSDFVVRAVVFEQGSFIDAGKPEGIRAAMAEGPGRQES